MKTATERIEKIEKTLIRLQRELKENGLMHPDHSLKVDYNRSGHRVEVYKPDGSLYKDPFITDRYPSNILAPLLENLADCLGRRLYDL